MKPVLFVHLVEACAGGLNHVAETRFGEFTKRSDEKVFEPPSTIICPERAVETTVARMVAAQSSMAQAPLRTVLMSLKM